MNSIFSCGCCLCMQTWVGFLRQSGIVSLPLPIIRLALSTFGFGRKLGKPRKGDPLVFHPSGFGGLLRSHSSIHRIRLHLSVHNSPPIPTATITIRLLVRRNLSLHGQDSRLDSSLRQIWQIWQTGSMIQVVRVTSAPFPCPYEIATSPSVCQTLSFNNVDISPVASLPGAKPNVSMVACPAS